MSLERQAVRFDSLLIQSITYPIAPYVILRNGRSMFGVCSFQSIRWTGYFQGGQGPSGSSGAKYRREFIMIEPRRHPIPLPTPEVTGPAKQPLRRHIKELGL